MSTALDGFISKMKIEIDSGVVRLSEPMSIHTTMGIGGPADVFAAPENGKDLRRIAESAIELELPVKIVGAGSNLLVCDEGFRGLVITTKSAFRSIEADGETVRAGSGVTLGRLIQACQKLGLSGLEPLSGIPGTLGGALYMNAGAYGTEISRFVEKAHVLFKADLKGRDLTAESMSFGYRTSSFTQDDIIESTELVLPSGDSSAIARRVDEFVEKRRSTQPIWDRSAGCIFKNPDNRSAGKMIDEAGLKGMSVGGASVSDTHGNYIINTGGATFSDVMKLIDIIREKIQDAFDTELDLEVEILR
jgi:UDP-N-acetylmuramate dehydrogenase